MHRFYNLQNWLTLYSNTLPEFTFLASEVTLMIQVQKGVIYNMPNELCEYYTSKVAQKVNRLIGV